MIENGELILPYKIYTCAKCGEEVKESHPKEFINDEVYCGDCAFLEGLITEQEYVKRHCRYVLLDDVRAYVKDGKICFTTGKLPSEKTAKEQRTSQDYIEWRKAVFERDNFTCAICQQVGGTLNAHHIRPFKDFPAERLNVDNGITLCETCHRQVHKDKNTEWIKGKNNG